ncbi:MAG: efflux RND transporter periplasmic adaptor subunit [Bdellovibrionales bacterium]
MKKYLLPVLLVIIGLGVLWKVLFKELPHSIMRSSKRTGQSPGKRLVVYLSYASTYHFEEFRANLPICGMDLVPAEKFEDANENAEESDHMGGMSQHSPVKLSGEQQKRIGIKVDRVKKEKLFKSINAPGRIAFDPELYTAQSEYLEALRQWVRVKESPLTDVRKSTSEMIRSAKIRLKVLGLSDEQINELSRKGSQSEGLLVAGKGQENWVYADVYEIDIPQIKKGLAAQITANFLQGRALAGEVVSIDQVINPETRTAKVRIRLIDTDMPIRPESYVNVKILAPQGEHLSVPIDALMDTGRETFIFVKSQDGNFEPINITVLMETDDRIAIAGSVHEGDEVVVGGNFMLDSESRLNSVLRSSSTKHEH